MVDIEKLGWAMDFVKGRCTFTSRSMFFILRGQIKDKTDIYIGIVGELQVTSVTREKASKDERLFWSMTLACSNRHLLIII